MHLHSGTPAIQEQAGHWTYAELDAACTLLTTALLQRQAQVGDVIAVYARRSAALVVALLAIVRARMAFVILDPRYPTHRTSQCLGAARPKVLLNLMPNIAMSADLREAIVNAGIRATLDVPESKSGLLALAIEPNTAGPVRATADPTDTLYVAFTSGTTGRPKAIVGAHGPVAHFLEWQRVTFHLSDQHRVSLLSGLAHDPLLRDVFLPLWIGGTVCIPESDAFESHGKLRRWLRDTGVTIVHLTPALGHLLLVGLDTDQHFSLPSLNYAFFGGDMLRTTQLEYFSRVAPRATFVNCYGATETPQVMGYHVVPRESAPTADGSPRDSHLVPVGQGIDECQLLVFDQARRLCDVGVVGEVCVRTLHRAKAILTNGTAEPAVFIRNPYTDDPLDLIYPTGDFGYYLPNGAVVCQGRRDRQVKIRGFRVELAEIDRVLLSMRDVLQHHVDVEGDSEETRRLVLYVVLRTDSRLQARDLERWLAAELPNFMLPEQLIIIDRMPLTPNGKIDVAALRAAGTRDRDADADDNCVKSTTVEGALLAIFRHTLYSKSIGLDTDIFQAGLNSLQAVEVCCMIERQFGVQVSIGALTSARTIRQLALLIPNRSLDNITATGDVALAPRAASPATDAAEPRLGLPVDACVTGGAPSAPPKGKSRLGPRLIPERENLLVAIRNRILQVFARVAPDVWRVRLHRIRGVRIGEGVSIGYDTILETSYPWLVRIGNHVNIGIRVTVLGHFRGMAPVEKGGVTVDIRDDVFVGPGVIILPNVTIGKGAVVGAGSVVNESVPAATFVQGIPAKPIASCGLALSRTTTYEQFISNLSHWQPGPTKALKQTD